jgi:hypothetical protein
MTLAVMGYHFQVITRRLSKAIDSPALAPAAQSSLAAEDSTQTP